MKKTMTRPSGFEGSIYNRINNTAEFKKRLRYRVGDAIARGERTHKRPDGKRVPAFKMKQEHFVWHDNAAEGEPVRPDRVKRRTEWAAFRKNAPAEDSDDWTTTPHQMVLIQAPKRCQCCGEVKDPVQFRSNPFQDDNLHYICLDCEAAQTSKHTRPPIEYVQCVKCKVERPRDAFHTDSRASNGLKSRCVYCIAAEDDLAGEDLDVAIAG